jgi:hypothetical protein
VKHAVDRGVPNQLLRRSRYRAVGLLGAHGLFLFRSQQQTVEHVENNERNTDAKKERQ